VSGKSLAPRFVTSAPESNISPLPLPSAGFKMRVRCWNCGSRKPEPVYRPKSLCWIAKAFGCRLCRCGGCHRLRLIRLQDLIRSQESPEYLTSYPAAAQFSPLQTMTETAALTGRGVSGGGNQMQASNQCPQCGSSNYQRSPRTQAERLVKSGPMARCLRCGYRFPLSQS